ncbi:hypothetical protein [Devosia psychrophila]|uniref:Uncharacterized protein n=1 Tax=Devosia psychrophila TaxID=728005 RepID=A0A1I1GV69_9HYPH|nr:hypothetical protein [Devosia psychrophila]SFC15385.1 hypothetical protein SAMN04488059_102311 [Devosia psychrophila]
MRTAASRVLAASNWMSTISTRPDPTRPDEVVPLLPGETCALATLAMQHPGNVPAAVKRIAAYKG